MRVAQDEENQFWLFARLDVTGKDRRSSGLLRTPGNRRTRRLFCAGIGELLDAVHHGGARGLAPRRPMGEERWARIVFAVRRPARRPPSSLNLAANVGRDIAKRRGRLPGSVCDIHSSPTMPVSGWPTMANGCSSSRLQDLACARQVSLPT